MNEQILHSLEQYARSQGENVVVSDENGEMIVRMQIRTTPFEGRIKYVPRLTCELYLALSSTDS